eukprot:CAMPEP_0113668602 /NCGR_PEP_ID=MMETSP0038_2-20120614/4094_1 /TAXON_ID=2898 /ORGANISM="Cryptomonas paramecium" /LENGTH=41 /DNA_ID=CAMNT_0000584369 /DNA_START=238 /DNA_END=360 /DNA_ORIENTATION=+ /assembly_acc=CAM_ASM_000170
MMAMAVLAALIVAPTLWAVDLSSRHSLSLPWALADDSKAAQ